MLILTKFSELVRPEMAKYTFDPKDPTNQDRYPELAAKPTEINEKR